MVNEHRRGVLHIISARLEIDIESERHTLLQVSASGAPWHTTYGIIAQTDATAIVHTNRHRRIGGGDCFQQSIALIGEDVAHLRCKIVGKFYHIVRHLKRLCRDVCVRHSLRYFAIESLAKAGSVRMLID